MNRFLTDLDTRFRVEHFKGLSVMMHAHVHALYELYFCTENVEQKSIINGIEYVYHYPCVILSPPYTVHSMSCEDPDAVDFDRYVFYFNEEMVPAKMRSMVGGTIFRLSEEQADYLKRLLVWCEEVPSANATREWELTCMLLLSRLFEICSEEHTVSVESGPNYIQSVLQYVSAHLSEPIDAKEIARRFSVSRSKLDRDFKRYTQNTFHDYLESCRLNLAKSLLCVVPPLSIREIAPRCGFESESYFFPFFKRQTGMTPLEFRNQLSKTSFC